MKNHSEITEQEFMGTLLFPVGIDDDNLSLVSSHDNCAAKYYLVEGD